MDQLAYETTNIGSSCSLTCPEYNYDLTEAENQTACTANAHCTWNNGGYYGYPCCEAPSDQNTCETTHGGTWYNSVILDYVPYVISDGSFGIANSPTSVDCFNFSNSDSCLDGSNGAFVPGKTTAPKMVNYLVMDNVRGTQVQVPVNQ